MPGVVGQQDLWVVGSRFYFRRDGDAYQVLYDFGTISGAVSPTLSPETIECIDGDGGVQRVVDEALIRTEETYELELRNFTLDNLALFFLAAAPQEFSQSADELTDVPHFAAKGPGQMVKLQTAAGVWLYNIDTIEVKSEGGGTTYTENTDWKWVSKERGIIQILLGSAIVHGQTLHIDITPNALGGERLVLPQTGGAAVKGRAALVWGRNNNEFQTVREFECSLTPSAGNFQVEDYSSLTLRARVLSSATDQVVPAGRLLQFAGDLPTAPAS